MRMVPVNHVFRKFPKIVRELASEREKKVRLEIYGRETELDKGIVDALGEPLVHVIRNSIDHGIEAPSVRTEAAKPEEAVITLRAYHEAAQIVIEVSDDGRGIDISAVKKKAVKMNLLAVEESDKLSDQDALKYIFLPGLSTSDTVGDISGRGIGMDAVRNSVENMKGSVEMKSEPGKGTNLTIRLPLTLAVIKALLFEVGDRSYAVPVSAISEVTRIITDMLVSVEGRDALMLRERVISIIRIEELLGIQGSSSGKKFILILNIKEKRVGLLVDRLIGQQELVIKAMEGDYAGSTIVAGASILGNGRVVLILDAPALFKKAVDDERRVKVTL
jgi:two-component system, chemotaxis family, sensor kinase CheA